MPSALFGKTRLEVLSLLFSQPGESFYLREIVRAVRCGQGGVQRELRRLERAGILRRTARGRTVFYRADQTCPIFGDLRALVAGLRNAPAGSPQLPAGEIRGERPPSGGGRDRWAGSMPTELL